MPEWNEQVSTVKRIRLSIQLQNLGVKKVLPHFWCTCVKVVKGRTLARSSSKPARPSIWRLMVLILPTWPSTGPLLYASDTAASTSA